MGTPILSIGMIFRDDIRCIERCLKALEPLRKAVPSELIMADTGSMDGSRKIAEQYADKIIDFKWIDDFAAARNAVLEQCQGVWNLTVDTDEYLDPNIEEITSFLMNPENLKYKYSFLVIRNYSDDDMVEGEGEDFLALRVFQRNICYIGKIHESVYASVDEGIYNLGSTIFHHDGYSVERFKKKQHRNLGLIEESLKSHPTSLRRVTQCLESSYTEEQTRKYCDMGVRLIRSGKATDMEYGAEFLRNAVLKGTGFHTPDLSDWIDLARNKFGDSPFIQIDVSLYSALYYQKSDPDRALEDFRIYWNGIQKYENHEYSWSQLYSGAIKCSTASVKDSARLSMGQIYTEREQWRDALEMLGRIDVAKSNTDNIIANWLSQLVNLWWRSQEDVSPVLISGWKSILEDSSDRVEKRKQSFLGECRMLLDMKMADQNLPKDARLTEELLIHLGDDCPAGLSAHIICTDDRKKAETLLDKIQSWKYIPTKVVIHAVKVNADLPESYYDMPSEELEIQAVSLVERCDDDIIDLLSADISSGEILTEGKLLWIYDLALARTLHHKWNSASSEKIAEQYAEATEKYMERFLPPILREEKNLHILAPTLRYGWYYLQARKKLQAGDTTTYIQLLRKGLKTAPMFKKFTAWLCGNVQNQIKQQDRNAQELKKLAEQVKQILQSYPDNHPAVIVLKNSSAYKKVEHLLH